MKFWNEVILPALQNVFADILGVLPKLLAALVILLIGWMIAKLLDNFARRVLQRVGFNKLADKTGISSFLKNAGFQKDVSWVIGKLIYWMLMLIFLLSAAETLELTALALSVQKIVAFIPNLIAVVLILVFGSMFANIAGRFVRGAATEAGFDFAAFLGKLVTNIIIIAVAVIAITQLEIQSSVLDITFAAILGAFALAIAITLGLGTRAVSNNIISGVYARKTFQPGNHIIVNQIEGEIISIGTVNCAVKTSKGIVNMPNSDLIEQATLIQDVK